jgi:hypothetical protein
MQNGMIKLVKICVTSDAKAAPDGPHIGMNIIFSATLSRAAAI